MVVVRLYGENKLRTALWTPQSPANKILAFLGDGLGVMIAGHSLELMLYKLLCVSVPLQEFSFTIRSFDRSIDLFIMLCSQIYTCLFLGAVTYAKYIVPGARWRDTNGDLVNAHAGGVTVDKNGTFWWFGEYKVEGQEEGGGVSVYSSEDLATWTHHGKALGSCNCYHHSSYLKLILSSQEPIEGHPYIAPSSIIQRPKVVYSAPLDQYHVGTIAPFSLPFSNSNIALVARRQLNLRSPSSRSCRLQNDRRTLQLRKCHRAPRKLVPGFRHFHRLQRRQIVLSLLQWRSKRGTWRVPYEFQQWVDRSRWGRS